MKTKHTLNAGDRVRKRGFDHRGTVEKIATLGVSVRWDDGPLAKERPTYCAPGELELLPDADKAPSR